MNKVPDYVVGPILQFVASCNATMQLLQLSLGGVSFYRNLPETILRSVENDKTPCTPAQEKERRLVAERNSEDARPLAEFAWRELLNGCTSFHSQTLVVLWGALEVAIDDCVVGLFLNEPSVLLTESIAKIRIPLAQFENLEKEDRMRLLLEEIKRTPMVGPRQAIDRFEGILGILNLSGPVNPDTKKTVWEDYNLRNVIVHRASVADRRLVTNCPWLGIKVGDRVIVHHQQLLGYKTALIEYADNVAGRLVARYGATGPISPTH